MSEPAFEGEYESRGERDHELEGAPDGDGAPGGEPEAEDVFLAGQCVPEDVLRLDGVEWTEFEADSLVEIAKLSQRLIGQVQAVQLNAVAELRKRRGNERETADEVGLAPAASTGPERHVSPNPNPSPSRRSRRPCPTRSHPSHQTPDRHRSELSIQT